MEPYVVLSNYCSRKIFNRIVKPPKKLSRPEDLQLFHNTKKQVKMKLSAILVSVSLLTTNAFGFSPQSSATKSAVTNPALVSPLRKQTPATSSSLFRDPSVTRGGAVPGWAAYNEALDKNPITAKAGTSFVGFFLGDLLAQVRNTSLRFF